MSAAAAPGRPARDLALVAIFAGIVAALGVVPAFQPPGVSVPITTQSMGVMLAGGILGARRGSSALLVFLALVAVGLPVLAGGRGGLGVFFGPSTGFLVGFPLTAFAVGAITERGGPAYRLPWGIVANLVGGVLLLYAAGIAGLVATSHISVAAAAVSVWIFVPGDLAKAVLAAVVARGVHAAYPGLLDARRARREQEHCPV